MDRRCAIYTRMSTAAGLEQEFNSLDAQRQCCENYVRAMALEGWRKSSGVGNCCLTAV